MDCISNYIPDTDEYSSTDYADGELQQLRDESDFARRKATALQKLLDGSPLDLTCVPTERLLIEWHVQSLLDEVQRTNTAIREREELQESPPPYHEPHNTDPDRPYYRECQNCGCAFRKTETARMDYRGRLFCDSKCIRGHSHTERLVSYE
jgi:hypothetical protein